MARKPKQKVEHKEFPASFGVLDATYHEAQQVLFVEVYNHGNSEVLMYSGVPREVFDGLIKAESKGGFFNRNIRNDFNFLGKVKK